ncbi:MAG: arylsulfatase [Bryobacterales bacterium]|nr:arylsulfatase [Bryobacterales bacterium]
MELTRRHLLGAAAATAAFPQPAPTRPNILFILADDLGFGDLECYGQQRIRTPHISRLAAEGIRFTQAYSGSTVCAPSRCCLMTGKHTGHATIRGNRKPELGLAPHEATAASLLKSAGYRTALFGKWGLGGFDMDSTPNSKGFDEFFGYLNQLHAHTSFPEHIWENRTEIFLTDNWFHQRKTFSNDLFTEKAVNFLERQTTRQPFFLYLTYTIPHANNELGRFQKNGMECPDLGVYAKEDWPEVERTFAAAITRMDTGIGRVLDTLKARGLDENTLVFFASDNGPHHEGNHDANFFHSSGVLRGTKRDLYEGGVRVPMIARWKGKITPGQTSAFPWAFWDFLPTAAEIAGLPAPAGIDGFSILPTLLGKKQKPHDHFYWEFHEGGFQQAVRKGDWKLVRQRPRMNFELFNLEHDLGETRDVAAENPAIVADLRALFRASRADNKEFPIQER